MRTGSLLVGILLAVTGCKGTLPKALKSSPGSILTGKVSTAGLPGTAAPDFVGEVLFGHSPRDLSPDTILVVSRDLEMDGGVYFRHSRFAPQVQWVFLLDSTYAPKVVKNLQKKVEGGDPCDNITIVGYDGKTQVNTWIVSPYHEFVITQSGKILALCNDQDLESMLAKAVQGKIDPATQSATILAQAADFVKAQKVLNSIYPGPDTQFPSFAQIRFKLMSKMNQVGPDGKGLLAMAIATYSQCRPVSEIRDVLKIVAKLPHPANVLMHEVNSHIGHPDCTERLRTELLIAKADFSLADDPFYCKNYAQVALSLKDKSLAIYFANLMMRAPQFRHRAEKRRRDYYQAEYDDLVYHANHLSP
ncbi:MAG: hypothetical protein GC165_15180 [Armatimonadetes bacterium]|nr:hypothetical protein [Armatimonadota bacterium]